MKWGCSRRTSLRDIELAQSELANALNSVELQQMVGWMATQYQRLAAKAERDGHYASAVGALNALRALDLLVLEHGLEHVSEQVFRETQCRKALRERNHLPEWEMLRAIGVPSKAQIGSLSNLDYSPVLAIGLV